MLNLAAFKYRRALAESGGPIARIASSPVLIYGRHIHQADAFLAPGLSPRKPGVEKNRRADGTGSNKSPKIARNMAVSKAIERWALHAEFAGPNACRYGLNDDFAAKGMTAFPGFFKTQARKRAHLDALELLSLVAWWNGQIKATPAASDLLGVTVLRLHPIGRFGEVVIVYRKSKSGHVSYGYAAGTSLAAATTRAVIELAQNECLITSHKICGRMNPTPNYLDRRCLHFATPEGHQEFIARLETTPDKPAPAWDPIFDGEISGPWSRYATVWRTALRMPTQDYLNPSLNFFYW